MPKLARSFFQFYPRSTYLKSCIWYFQAYSFQFYPRSTDIYISHVTKQMPILSILSKINILSPVPQCQGIPDPFNSIQDQREGDTCVSFVLYDTFQFYPRSTLCQVPRESNGEWWLSILSKINLLSWGLSKCVVRPLSILSKINRSHHEKQADGVDTFNSIQDQQVLVAEVLLQRTTLSILSKINGNPSTWS